MAKRKKKKKVAWQSQLTFELVGLGILVIAVVALAQLGTVGETLVRLFRFFLGEWYAVLSIALLVAALYIMVKREKPPLWSRRIGGLYLMLLSALLFSHVGLFGQLQGNEGFSDQSVIRNTWNLFWLDMYGEVQHSDLGGGMIGAIAYAASHFLFADGGTLFLCFILFMAGLILLTGHSITDLFGKAIRRTYLWVVDFIKGTWNEWKQFRKESKEKLEQDRKLLKERKEKKAAKRSRNEDPAQEENDQPLEIVDFSQRVSHEAKNDATVKQQVKPAKQEDQVSKEAPEEDKLASQGQEGEEMPTVSLATAVTPNDDYQLPTIELLKLPNNPNQSMEKRLLHKNAEKLRKTLESFGVKAHVSKVHLGPAVTKYEVNPHVGVKVSRIVNLADDLALALAAKDIRIEAPIPGKSAIGIEVPNQEVAIVTLREVLDSPQAKADRNVLSVGLGRDISGEPVFAPLNKMPHLLVAGATGSGKSVCINGIITSILLKAKPHEVKLMMIDPKMVELNVYNGIPHLLTPVVTEPKKASQALKKVVAEMERRYDLFSHSGTRNIEGYNEMITRQNEKEDAKQPTLPYIVVIVDELADLMMVASGDVEDSIARLAQMARAAGIHMILATQRPSVDVITGVIKANIPSRIAFGVSSQTDSRTILDTGGAEKLLGRGDMLYLPMGATKPTRVQGAFLSDEEVETIVEFVVAQQKAQYAEEMTPTEETKVTEKVDDELYDDAVNLVIEMNSASVSMLQRRFRIGYTRAARLIDEMEARGIVGPYEGSKPREVLVQAQDDEASSH
ncbi:DNA translocase FtsK [Halalkalibacterium halodurans]|uniref:DNA translocase FtsK n=1 Tax=Halalkalibacterium halodurans (strain ATCC BAA-125 / DSM 18197 / FERM 7344 / JCM 9153 / C-125) TaxID=272558 RepID=FTSK_HALH5|nr:DNA translocase FtsK [Halalkalibacterium halodurans]Q9KA95.1 RecName: Full=DNA translocase FtsK [Halalkalibacterium halodurans C-125]MED4080060.1 DNA translocase FtsK [Halalkalibacterium halodurans]MED4086827.1 DNA translocase FtsK [Halalkalibacterium halodurans]MED4104261.1 DNA translocase FtsK [Halalkalibacterium halodurans]MED4110381.1 DNA translocase FtsK [Halalkalibacterium halodurans]MED4124389.1 DNA translocase FtsK [Halalkalibacterium halodurans]